jgi:hypothetical protein
VAKVALITGVTPAGIGHSIVDEADLPAEAIASSLGVVYDGKRIPMFGAPPMIQLLHRLLLQCGQAPDWKDDPSYSWADQRRKA